MQHTEHLTYVIEEAGGFLGDAWRPMTFPVYHHLLSLRPSPRHPEQGDTRIVQPVAFTAHVDGEPAGLLLAEKPHGAGLDPRRTRVPEMLSLFVRPEARAEGIGTALVERLQETLRKEGFPAVAAVYVTGEPGIVALERILAKCGWSDPVTRTVTVRFTPEQALQTPWFGKIELPGDEYEIFPWTELTEAERERLKSSNEAEAWIDPGLEPWKHDAQGFCPISSVGLRRRGEVIGWVINHRISEDTIRFTCSFVRRDQLRRLGRSMPLFSASIARLHQAAACRWCSFMTPVQYKGMVRFIERHCAPWAEYTGESRGALKMFAS